VLVLISDVFLLTLISKLLNVWVDIVDDGFVVICVKEFTLTFKELISFVLVVISLLFFDIDDVKLFIEFHVCFVLFLLLINLRLNYYNQLFV